MYFSTCRQVLVLKAALCSWCSFGFFCVVQVTVDSVREEIWCIYDAGPRSIRCPLIFLPPVSSTADIFFRQILYLASLGYRVIAVSNRGHQSVVEIWPVVHIGALYVKMFILLGMEYCHFLQSCTRHSSDSMVLSSVSMSVCLAPDANHPFIFLACSTVFLGWKSCSLQLLQYFQVLQNVVIRLGMKHAKKRNAVR